ncbi:MAG: hypothetical protein CVT70_00710 [Alphaproteobacteria bacterium HGW-Alphaproteobacteria-1]|jgi:hypothetical protein|nr:MAG: hypothetical protein CVT70_00710 [Alphaproteobacteria bacterium HGW-Alphaproteobacteria-1]
MARPFLLSLAGLVGLAGVLGLMLGLRAFDTTETEVIERVAARYVAETGGTVSDCAAWPATSAGLWLVVICGSEGGRVEYFVDRTGRVADRQEDEV